MSRAWLIYKYHFVIIIILFLLYLNIPIYHEAWEKWLFPNHSNPYHFTLYEILLLHQPNYMDVLPIYMIFILFTPFILIQLNKRNYMFIFIVSVSIWIIGQSFNFMTEVVKMLQLNTTPGYFNIFSWQLIWTMGVYLGYAKSSNIEIRLPKTRIFFFIVLVSAIIFLLSRHNILEFGRHFILSFTEKQTLEVFRLLNFLLMVYLVGIVISKIPIDKGIPWLQYIGRYSIDVFSFHVLLIYLLLPLWSYIDISNDIINITFEFLIIASLSIPAYIADRYKKSRHIHRMCTKKNEFMMPK